MDAKSIIATENAPKIMRWTLGHFKPKVPAQYDATHSSVEFPFGTCQMQATTSEPIVTVQAKDAKSLTSVKDIVGRHLEKFGIKEHIKVEWENES